MNESKFKTDANENKWEKKKNKQVPPTNEWMIQQMKKQTSKQTKWFILPVYNIPSELRQGAARTSSGMVNGSFWKKWKWKKNVIKIF